MIRVLASIVVSLALIGLAACSRIETRAEAAAGADFSALKTYAWVPRKTRGGKKFSERFLFTDQRIREAVDRELAKRGFRRVGEDAQPDFWVQYYTWADEGVTAGGPYQDYERWGVRRMGTLDAATTRHGDYRMSARDVRQGTLIITILDGDSQRELWRGSAEAPVQNQHDRDKLGRLIDQAVQRILSAFPPTPAAPQPRS